MGIRETGASDKNLSRILGLSRCCPTSSLIGHLVSNLKHGDFLKKLSERIPQYKARWENSLAEQIHDLPDFDKVEREVQRALKKFKP